MNVLRIKCIGRGKVMLRQRALKEIEFSLSSE